MSELRLLLVRHGVTDWNREGRFQGHLDPPLSEAGRNEARLLAGRMAGDPALRPSRILSSTLGRAAQTAEAIAETLDVPLETDRRLMEIGQGEWEGRTHADLEREDAARYRAWRAATGIRQPPGGEPIEAATSRVRDLLHDLTSATAVDGGVCIVSHGGTLRILAHVLFSLEDVHSLDVDNASLSLATRGRIGWRLDRWNDTLHLLGQERTHVDELEGRPLAL